MLPPGLAPPGGPPPGPGGGHPPPAVVNAILQRMGAGGPGGPGASAPPKPNGHGLSTLEQIQSLIQDTHDAMRNISDPSIVNVLSGCLKALTGVQATLSKTGPAGQ